MDTTQNRIEFTSEYLLNHAYTNESLQLLAETDSRYLRDLKMNVRNVLNSEHLSQKEAAMIALAISANDTNKMLLKYFKQLSVEQGASLQELAEAVACASLLSNNNVLYRFRHITAKEEYNHFPAKLRMNIMSKPMMGKELFELISLAVSAVNACELCIKSHEKSLIALGCPEEKIFDSIRIASVIVSLGKIIY